MDDYQGRIVDLRPMQNDPPKVPKKHKMAAGKVVKRDPKRITGITLHQCAVFFGVAKNAKDRHAALHERGLGIGCHVWAVDGQGAGLECGHVVVCNPLDWWVYHGNGLNEFSLGLEVDGLYPGLVSQTGKRPTDRIIETSRLALRWMVEEGRRLGMPIEHIWAHRQASDTRRADPGEALWRALVVDYAVPVLGLRTHPADVLGKGAPIPAAWDPEGVGAY